MEAREERIAATHCISTPIKNPSDALDMGRTFSLGTWQISLFPAESVFRGIFRRFLLGAMYEIFASRYLSRRIGREYRGMGYFAEWILFAGDG